MDDVKISTRGLQSLKCIFASKYLLIIVMTVCISKETLAYVYDGDYGPWYFAPVGGDTDKITVLPGNHQFLSVRYTCFQNNKFIGHTEVSCGYPIEWDYDHKSANAYNKQQLTCTAVTNGITVNLDFSKSNVVIGAWTLNYERGQYGNISKPTSNQLLGIADIYGQYANLKIDATLSDESGVVLKPLVITCKADLVPSDKQLTLTRTFNPQLSALFTATRVTTETVSHRTKDEGIHIYKLDFGQTVWYTKRSLTHTFDYENCGLTTALTTLHYDDSPPLTLTENRNDFNPGSTLNLLTTNTIDPKVAYYRLRAKKSTAGEYNCNATITQTVE